MREADIHATGPGWHMGRRRILAGFSLAALAGAGLLVLTSTRGAWATSAPVREIRGDDAPPCGGATCDPSPPASSAVPPPAALNLACGLQLTGRECRLSSAAIPACSAADNEAFELAVREQAGARVDPTLTRTNSLGVAFVDRGGGTPSYVWKPAFSTKKTYCGTVVGVDPSSGGAFWGPENDERIRVLPSAGFQSLRTVAAGLADDPSPQGCGKDGSQPGEACLASAVTQPVLPSGFLPTKGMTHCAFGPVVNDYTGPSSRGRPEIHPQETQWWAPRAGRQWLIKGSQDGSQRFTVAGWAAPRRCPSFTCDPPPDAWRNFAARALPHAVEIAFELDLRETQGASFNITTLEDDNTRLTANDAAWGMGQDRGAFHDLLVDDRLMLQVGEGNDAASHVDLRDVCRIGTILRGYLRVAFVTGSAPLLEDASGRRYGRKTIQVARGALGAPPPPDSQARYPRAARLGARAPHWNSPSIHDDDGVRQDLRSWREGYRLVGITSERAGPLPFREVTPTRALDWVDAGILPDFDLLRDRGRLTFMFANRDKSYSLSVGSNPPRPTFDLVREKALRVVDTDAAPVMVRLAGGVANAWPALASLYDVVRYGSLDLHVKPGYLDANTSEDTDLSGMLNDALNTPPEARVKVFGSATPFKAAWRLRACDAETREDLPVREGQPDGTATVFTVPGEPDGLTEGASLRVHFPDRQGRITLMSVEVTLTDPAGHSTTRQFELLSHVGWTRAPADWEALRGPLASLAAVQLDEVARDAGLLNGTAARAAVLANVPPRPFHADALWTFASRTGLAHSRLEVSTLRTLIDLARNYARSGVTN